VARCLEAGVSYGCRSPADDATDLESMLRLSGLANGNEKPAFLPAELTLESQYVA
jgi:hypothetical protein